MQASLPGEPDAAVQLHRLSADEGSVGCRAAAGGESQQAAAKRADGAGGANRDGLRELELDESVCAPVLVCLERADRLIELGPDGRVSKRLVECGACGADSVERGGRGAAGHEVGKKVRATGPAEHG